MASNSTLQAVKTGGPLQGFGNLAAKETGGWWKTRMWWTQVLIWAAIANGILALVLFASGDATSITGRSRFDQGVQLFLIIGCMATAVGTVIIGQDALIDEKRSGTAAWILSKPITRPAFILSKFAAHALGMLVTMVLIQGALAFALLAAGTGRAPSVPGWLAGLALMYLFLLFFLALTLMLGAFFNTRGPVIGIPMILIFGYQFFLGVAPWIADVLPYRLVVPVGPQPSLAEQLIHGQALGNPLSLALVFVWIVLFIAVAVWRFQREEF